MVQAMRRRGMGVQGSVRGLVVGLAASVALGSLPLLVLPAAASGPTSLGVTSFGRILVDPATSHTFVSSPGSSDIFVLDFNGNIVKTITGEAGADAMAIVGNTLYVSLTTTGAIDKIDTGTLTETGVLVNGLVRPGDLFYAGSKLWSTSGNCASSTVELVSVDPAAPTPTVTHYPGVFNGANALAFCARFASNPASNPNLLLGWDLGSNPAQITTFDVSSGSPVQKASALEGILGNLQDVAVNPGGTHFITASGAPYEFDEWNVADLTQDGVIYPANTYPTAVATSPAAGGLMGGGLNGIYDPDFYAYQIGHPAAPLAKVDFGGTSNTVPSRGVAISPDGSVAFVISGYLGAPVYLNLVPIPVPGAPSPATGVTATAGYASATVAWTPPANVGNSPITKYTVTSNPGGVQATTNGSTTSVVVSPLTIGTSYTFTVTATNTQGTSAPSAPSNAVVPTGPLPAAPTNVTATPADGAAFVSWSAPADTGGLPIIAYQVTPYEGSSQRAATTVSGTPPPTSAFVTGLNNNSSYTFTVGATTSNGTGPPSSPSNAVTPLQGGNDHPLAPARILDTRYGVGAPTGRLGPGGSLTVPIAGQGGVPASGVSAVVLNVTVTNTTAASYLTVYPSGRQQPLASNLNWTAGETVPNLVEVALGGRGSVTIYNAAGQTDVIFDVAGWVGVASNSLTKDGLYNSVVPVRVLDTRDGTGGVPHAPVGPGQTVSIRVAGTLNIPATGVAAVILNVTVTNPTAASYLTVFPSGTPPPLASNLNFVAGQTVPNRVIVKLGSNGTPGWVSFYNAAGTVDVIADVGGWFTDSSSTAGGTRFTGFLPFRLFDSRQPGIGPIGPGQTAPLTLYDQNGQPVNGVSAIVINVTVTNPTAPSYLTLWPGGSPQPLASDLNFVAGQTVPNLVVVKLSAPTQLGAPATFNIYNAAGSTDVIIDLVGFYGTPQAAPTGQPAAIVMRLAPGAASY